MTDFLTYIATWSVLKWVLLVLIAGFIGQFGKMLAEAIINRVRLRRAGRHEPANHSRLSQESSTPFAAISPKEFPSGTAVSSDVSDKKLLKIEAKARKKEAKEKG